MVTSTAAAAQAPAQLRSKAVSAAGPTVAASTAGIRAPSQAKSVNASDSHMGAGTNVALMVVGGVAMIIGAIIDYHTVGLLIAVGGAAIFLYGLFNFIQ